MSASHLLSRADLDFLLYDWLKAEQLTARPAFAEHSRDTFDGLLDLSATIAAEVLEPINALLDAQEPRIGGDGEVIHPEGLREAIQAYGEAGLTAAGFPEEVGGMQVPNVVAAAALGIAQSASAGAAAYPLLAGGNARLLVAHGSAEQVERFALPLIEGRWLGTMCLSEPQAGSSLGDITTRAERRDDGRYRIFGTKMWISGGDHSLSENIIHLVLARTGDGAGTKGISLFVVPKFLVADDGALGERNDVVLVGLNHKMGWRGTTNTLLNFGEGFAQPEGEAGAVGYLIGEEGRGLAYMFHMMNEARINVGQGAVALGYSGYRRSLAYARERPQGRPVDAKDPRSPMVPIIEHPDVRRMLLAQKSYVEGGLALVLYCARLVDEEATAQEEADRSRAASLLDLLTPIAKSWPSQWCLTANDLAIQVHGGYGYTRDYMVEQLYRDNRLNPIHEGTHGIQGLDLLGRKVVADGGRGLRILADAITQTIDAAQQRGAEPAEWAALLRTGLDSLTEVTELVWADGDAASALANASLYLEAAGHVVVAWLWLEQLLALTDDGAFAQGKHAAARYFFRYELPRIHPQLDLLASGDRTTLDLDPTVLG